MGKRQRLQTLIVFVFSLFLFLQNSMAWAQPVFDFPKFDYGPDRSNPMERELIEIIAGHPNLSEISKGLGVLTTKYRRGDKTRKEFGAMPMRGFTKKIPFKF